MRLNGIKELKISQLKFPNTFLVIKYGFSNLIWREGGADNGRDIEAIYTFVNPLKTRDVKYFFECKHYTSGGVPPEHLNSKIAWADAELPNSLVISGLSYKTSCWVIN